MMLFFSIFIPLLLGFLSCLLIFKGTKNIDLRLLTNLSLPIGIGISSIIFIVFNLLGLATFLTFLIETGLLIFLIFKFKNSQKTIYEFEWLNLNKLILNPILLLATALYFYSWILDAGIYFFDSIQNPHGLWDAWGDWNLGAKFISRDPEGWANSFHQIISTMFHTDYPLLQKAFIARCWILSKTETVWVPITFCFIFTFCTIGLLASSVSFFTNKTKGIIAGLILLCTPFYMTMGDSQYADNTVGYFYLATIVLLTLARNSESTKPHLLIAAGITAGLSGWSKNEGILFIICLFVSQLPLFFFKKPRKMFIELRYLLIGMLPILILIAYYKIKIAPPNEIIEAQGTRTFEKLTDYSRYAIAGKWFYEQFNAFGKWALNPWWLFLGGVLINGISFKKNRNTLISGLLLLLLMLTGFFLVFIVADLDLVFYLSTSVHRLFFQLFPSFIFIYFLALKDTTPSMESRDLAA